MNNNKVEQHKAICNMLNAIYQEKNSRYGDSFSLTFSELGVISAVTRMTDKMNRIKQLTTGKSETLDESLKDTLLDLANYAIMTVMELDKNK